jgi:hypothetical protein
MFSATTSANSYLRAVRPDQSIPFSTPVSRVTINYKSVGRYETR